MNFLAHLYLSGPDEHLLVGNFLAGITAFCTALVCVGLVQA